MAKERMGYYFDGQNRLDCIIKRTGANNTRITLEDGVERLVPSESVKEIATDSRVISSSRMIPTVPLETLYRHLRKLTGTKEEKFLALLALLEERHGPIGEQFLAELFLRSVKHAEFYNNIEEAFYPYRKVRCSSVSRFANNLVQEVSRLDKLAINDQEIAFVDYEIFPFRTTRSCHENGNRASRAGSGGMDLLLALASGGDVLPGIGEIKAGSEVVGPTFALIQSLMYASQLMTKNQFLRLKQHYPQSFGKLDEESPKVDLILIFEADQLPCDEDLKYAIGLATGVSELLKEYLRHVMFLKSKIENNSVTCTVLNS